MLDEELAATKESLCNLVRSTSRSLALLDGQEGGWKQASMQAKKQAWMKEEKANAAEKRAEQQAKDQARANAKKEAADKLKRDAEEQARKEAQEREEMEAEEKECARIFAARDAEEEEWAAVLAEAREQGKREVLAARCGGLSDASFRRDYR